VPGSCGSSLRELALGVVYGLGMAASVVRGQSIALGIAGLVLALSAPSMRRGSLGGRAVFGHAAFLLVVLAVVSLGGIHAAAVCAVPVLLLCHLMR